ncbi:MAG: hypothetical protein JXR07_15205 [Reichenbachiella sp.]
MWVLASIENLGFDLKGDFADFFIPEDESYVILIISKMKNEGSFNFFGKLDLFVSFKNREGNWTKPHNLGKEINGLSEWSWGPYVTNDNEYLFFSSWADPVGTYMIRFEELLINLKEQSLTP